MPIDDTVPRRHSPTDADLRDARDRYADLLRTERTTEREWQRFFAECPYVLSRALPLKLDPRDIVPRGTPGVAEADFHIYPHKPVSDGSYGVIELKRPDSLILVE